MKPLLLVWLYAVLATGAQALSCRVPPTIENRDLVFSGQQIWSEFFVLPYGEVWQFSLIRVDKHWKGPRRHYQFLVVGGVSGFQLENKSTGVHFVNFEEGYPASSLACGSYATVRSKRHDGFRVAHGSGNEMARSPKVGAKVDFSEPDDVLVAKGWLLKVPVSPLSTLDVVPTDTDLFLMRWRLALAWSRSTKNEEVERSLWRIRISAGFGSILAYGELDQLLKALEVDWRHEFRDYLR